MIPGTAGNDSTIKPPAKGGENSIPAHGRTVVDRVEGRRKEKGAAMCPLSAGWAL